MILGIVGAGELGQQIAHYASIDKICTKILFFDDVLEQNSENQFGKIAGKTKDIEKYYKSGFFDMIIIGIGYKHFAIRKHWFDILKGKIPFLTILHSTCHIDPTAKIGEGSILYPGCIVDKNCTIGNNVILNIGSLVCHDTVIGDHSFIGPGTKLAGFVKVGQQCFFGIGTICIDNIIICDNVYTAGGTVLTKDIVNPGVYAGIPAVIIRKY